MVPDVPVVAVAWFMGILGALVLVLFLGASIRTIRRSRGGGRG